MAEINMSYYIYMPAQLEKIQNEPDYRKKVDLAVDAIMAIYNEEQRLRHKQDSFRSMSYEYFQNLMISLYDFVREEEKKVYDALGLTDISKRNWLCEMAREKLSTTWPSFISTAKWQWKHVSAFGKFWDINEI
jgi:hypothetical protein